MRSHALSAPAVPPRSPPRPGSRGRWFPRFFLGLLPVLPACGPAAGDEPFLLPCADLLSHQENVDGDFSGVSAGSPVPFDPAGEECDPEEETLFLPTGTPHDAGHEENAEDTEEGKSDHDDDRGAHASLSFSHTPAQSLRRIVRHRAIHGAWSHAVEVRGDSLTRRRLTWEQPRARGPAWRVTVGDMTDTALRLWPHGLPRRALPVGWTPARGTPEAPQPWSTSLPQGIGAGLVHDGWSAYALRLWNPVAARGARPWDPAWDLHHEGAGAHIPLSPAASDGLPWHLHLHASATRITPSGLQDTGAARFGETGGGAPFSAGMGTMPFGERMLATELRSPARGLVLTAAVSENERAGPAPAGRGGLLGVVVRTRFGHAARGSRRTSVLDLDVTARQRSAGWMSAWDPALTAALLEEQWTHLSSGSGGSGAFDAFNALDTPGAPGALGAAADTLPQIAPGTGTTADEEPRAAAPAWGAGEVHAAGRWTAPRPGMTHTSFPSRLTLEYRRAWHPRAGTARRSLRGGAEWRLEKARLAVTATQRVSRSRSGARSLYRFTQAEARLTRFPRSRITAWRAWNGTGPLRTGFFLGADPSWNLARATLTVSPGLRLEVRTLAARETWATRASLGLRVRSRPWTFDAAADTPLPPGAAAAHCRIVLTVTRSVTQ